MGRPNTSWPFLLDRFFERPGTIPHRVVPFFMSAFYAYVFFEGFIGAVAKYNGPDPTEYAISSVGLPF